MLPREAELDRQLPDLHAAALVTVLVIMVVSQKIAPGMSWSVHDASAVRIVDAVGLQPRQTSQ